MAQITDDPEIMDTNQFVILLQSLTRNVALDNSSEGWIKYERGTKMGTYHVNAFLRDGSEEGERVTVIGKVIE